MSDLIAVTRDGPIATVVLNRPGEAQRADEGDVAGAGRGDRRAVRRRRAALRDPARRRREGVLARQRHRGVRDRAREQGAGDRLRPRHARDGARARRVPASAGRADPRHLRRRRTRDRRAVRSSHLRRIEPLRRADQESRPRHGLSGDGAARAPRRPRRRARDPARRPDLRRRRGEGEAARHARRSRRRRRRRGAARPRSASPTARRSSRAGTRSSRAASPIRGRSPPPSTTSASTASTPRISASATRRSSPSASPEFVGR